MGQRFNRPGSNLATIARETGYPVIEVPGWATHDHGAFSGHVGAIVCHHTAGPEPERTSSNYPSLNVVRNGRAGLPGPLSNYGLGYDGTIYVISAGTCWHAGRGGWAGMTANSQAIGIEAEDGGDGDWTAAQLDAYPRLCAAICQFLGVTAAAVCGHKEWCSPPARKIDPAGIDMRAFRTQVGHYLHNPHEIRRGAGRAPAAGPEPGGIESMALDTAWTDSYGNRQTVEGFMSETQRDLNRVVDALLANAPSRIPNDDNTTNMWNLQFDSGAWNAQTLGHVTALRGEVAALSRAAEALAGLVGAQQGLDVDAVKTAVKDAIADVVEGQTTVDIKVGVTDPEGRESGA